MRTNVFLGLSIVCSMIGTADINIAQASDKDGKRGYRAPRKYFRNFGLMPPYLTSNMRAELSENNTIGGTDEIEIPAHMIEHPLRVIRHRFHKGWKGVQRTTIPLNEIGQLDRGHFVSVKPQAKQQKPSQWFRKPTNDHDSYTEAHLPSRSVTSSGFEPEFAPYPDKQPFADERPRLITIGGRHYLIQYTQKSGCVVLGKISQNVEPIKVIYGNKTRELSTLINNPIFRDYLSIEELPVVSSKVKIAVVPADLWQLLANEMLWYGYRSGPIRIWTGE